MESLPILFASKVKLKYTWINLPLYLLACYICSGINIKPPVKEKPIAGCYRVHVPVKKYRSI